MSSVFLAYAPLEASWLKANRPSWKHLLQQRVAYETARAVLAGHGNEGPQLSEHVLFAPARLDLLPILALAARDYAQFAEPEGSERPQHAPIRLYESWRGEPPLDDASAAMNSMKNHKKPNIQP